MLDLKLRWLGRPFKRKIQAKKKTPHKQGAERNMVKFLREIHQLFIRSLFKPLSPLSLIRVFFAAFFGWSMWGDWGQCSKSCNSGTQERMRVCIESSPFNASVCDKVCNGSSIETRKCNTHQCPGQSLAGISNVIIISLFT